jgi:hypothetical protein
LCCARQSTSTPLQALALLNDIQLVEAARFVAELMLQKGGATRDDQLRWAFRTVTSRTPSVRELSILSRLHDEQHELFSQDPEAMNKLINYGETRTNVSLPPADLAAATVVAVALLNHDEAIMRR